ncbi:MAG: YeaH/YhbH family protein, partial [Rhodoferax sp.]|nr:YeaH/YhbH family protein [Rhodoferax sp.]
MGLQIIDRRLAGKNKSIGNRERFLRRYKEQITEAVRRAVSGRDIRDVERSEDITIPRRDISEPVFQHARGGVRETVHPGNREHLRGDTMERPQGGAGGHGGSASDSGEAEDDFVFTLSKDEFMQIFFEDLALPDMLRTQIGDNPEWKSHRAGYVRDGTPNNLSVVRSMRGALGRRIAMGREPRRLLADKRVQLCLLESRLPAAAPEIVLLRCEIAELERRGRRIPFLDPIDLRFRNRV